MNSGDPENQHRLKVARAWHRTNQLGYGTGEAEVTHPHSPAADSKF